MFPNDFARQHATAALNATAAALLRLEPSVRITNRDASEWHEDDEPDVLQFHKDTPEHPLIAECHAKKLIINNGLDHTTRGLVTAYCALFLTINPPKGV